MGDGVAQASACVVSGGVRGGVIGRGERRLCRLGVEDVGYGVERVRDERDAAGHVVGCGDGVRGWFGFGDVAGVDAQSGAVVEFGDEDDARSCAALSAAGSYPARMPSLLPMGSCAQYLVILGMGVLSVDAHSVDVLGR